MGYNSKYTGQEVEQLLDKVDDKQDTLISGTNIKTINGESILGSGNITLADADCSFEAEIVTRIDADGGRLYFNTFPDNFTNQRIFGLVKVKDGFNNYIDEGIGIITNYNARYNVIYIGASTYYSGYLTDLDHSGAGIELHKQTSFIANGSITTDKIANGAITADKIANGIVAPVTHALILPSAGIVQIEDLSSAIGYSGIVINEDDEGYIVPSYLENGLLYVCDIDYSYVVALDTDDEGNPIGTIEQKLPTKSQIYATKEELNSKQDTLVSGTNIKTINGTSILGSGNIKINSGSGDVANIAERVTYDELKSKRDSGELIAGCWYRIIDYTFTTVQEDTKSAGNVFDIIVLAVDKKTLNHNAFAALHEGDDYFANVEIDAWQLKYDLDNDTDKYAWADSTNGKDVIYRMIDEKRNDCPYDFKNALFYNEKITTGTTSDKFYYTFSYVVNDKLYDGTVENLVKKCYGNSMEVYLKSNKKSLNLNVFRCISFGNICYDNTFGYSCRSNTFGSGCYNNSFGNNVSYHELNSVRTSITLNDEYFDDGSGQLVPIKHPDLSTQPSILPYKFMGQYVYEQLIPITQEVINYFPKLFVDNPIFLKFDIIGDSFISSYAMGGPVREGSIVYLSEKEMILGKFIHVVYTSMPEEGGYYGYNNY